MKAYRRITAVAVSLLLALLTLPGTALAENETVLDISKGNIVLDVYRIEGYDKSGNKLSWPADSGYVITGESTVNTIKIIAGTYRITLDNVQIETNGCAFLIEPGAAVELTLVGESALTSGRENAGIQVLEGAALTIDGTGSLSVTGNGGAGIGGAAVSRNGNEIRKCSCGVVTILGGTVTATGLHGAGIGGGGGDRSADYTINGGDGGVITIAGGNVTATGHQGSAGIGGGIYGGGAGSITITGGSVAAYGSANSWGGGGAGIGAGQDSLLRESSGNDQVVITGGTVKAVGTNGVDDCSWSDGGAGIGTSATGSITISGGDIEALGYGSSAGIGGVGYGNNSSHGAIFISGGQIKAVGMDGGAGIGGGAGNSQTEAAGGYIQIFGGNVKAVGGESAKDIGDGGNAW